MRVIGGAEDRVKPERAMSGTLLCEGKDDLGPTPLLPSSGAGISDNGGRLGNNDAFRYSFPRGLSSVCICAHTGKWCAND